MNPENPDFTIEELTKISTMAYDHFLKANVKSEDAGEQLMLIGAFLGKLIDEDFSEKDLIYVCGKMILDDNENGVWLDKRFEFPYEEMRSKFSAVALVYLTLAGDM